MAKSRIVQPLPVGIFTLHNVGMVPWVHTRVPKPAHQSQSVKPFLYNKSCVTARQRSEPQVDDVTIAGVTVPVTRTVKSLGVTIGNTLSFDDHVKNVCKAAHFHIRALRHIRRCVSVDDAKSVATALVSSRLDYCNAILFGTSTSNLNKLQRVQNALARTVMMTKKCDHITPMLASG